MEEKQGNIWEDEEERGSGDGGGEIEVVGRSGGEGK
jgi:hypothetical protein